MAALATASADVRIPVRSALGPTMDSLPGKLVLPPKAAGIVVFAHGAGSSRLSPRNNQVAGAIREQGDLGTLLFDLLTAEEDEEYERRFDIPLLTSRLMTAIEWLMGHEVTGNMPIGLFGASTGAAAALEAAARLGTRVRAVVSRGGRPDLAMDVIERVEAPTLLIVGGHDPVVIDMNQSAFELLRVPKEFSVVPGATHLFEEPGALEEVSALATRWFERFMFMTEPWEQASAPWE